MERSAAKSDKSSKVDSSKESASRIRSEGENERRMELDPLRGLVPGRGCRGSACSPTLESVAQGVTALPGAQRREAAMALQRRRGNRFVQGMAVQAKLALGPVGDRYEQEADLVARRVVETISSPERDSVQRQEEGEFEDERDLEDGGTLRQKVAGLTSSEGADVGPGVESSIRVARGRGQPLSDGVRHSMERAFGVDFSRVRMHADGEADRLNRSIQARAFTRGHDIFLRQGEYRPESSEGQRLLAHELTHVVQQNGGSSKAITSPSSGFCRNIEPRCNSHPGIQLIRADEASELIENKYNKWKRWFYEVCIPAMQTIATKEGNDFNGYLAAMSQDEFEIEMKALHEEAKDEISVKEMLFQKGGLVESRNYPQMKRVSGTNILVDANISWEDNSLQRFINLYRNGNMMWYRGLSISHFSYSQLRGMGILGSEGWADIPTFTMGNAEPTRWLPGVHDPKLADAVASLVNTGEDGIKEIMSRKDIPIGVTVQYRITKPAHVAFLNDGEQLVRGPITGATVYRVVLLGSGSYSYRLRNGSTSELPPAAPYHAGVGSQEIVAWERDIDTWLLSHPS